MKQFIVAGDTTPEVSKREAYGRSLARQAAAEGIVLLKNNNVLPITEKKLALYGSGARRTVKGGTGSGAMHERYSVSIEEGLKNAGYKIMTEGWLDRFDQFYSDSYKEWKDGIEELVKDMANPMEALGVAIHNKFLYPTGILICDEELMAKECTTAIYAIARQAGEGNDRQIIKGDYELDDIELANIKMISEAYQKTVVVINCGGVIDLSFMDQYSIDGLFFFCQGGEEGGNGLADIISGKVSPSGKLTDTWAVRHSDYPSSSAFSTAGDPREQDYTEGIYVGYRYFDTFGVAPRYPFGFGLSYTTFDIRVENVSVNQERVAITVSVQNKGQAEGKEVVQVYAAVPEIEAGTEAKRLVAFVKTAALKPGEGTSLSLSFSLEELAVYDEQMAAFYLPEGDYILLVGNSSVATVPAAVICATENIVTEVCTRICPVRSEIKELIPAPRKREALDCDLRITISQKDVRTVSHSYLELPVYEDTSVKEKIESLSLEQLATLVVGGDTRGERIVMAMGASGSTTALLYETLGIPNVILSDGPAGLNLTPMVVELPDGSYKSAVMYEQYNFGAFRRMLLSNMAKPEDGIVHYHYATAWPASTLLAQTWNTGLLEQIGDVTGQEMEEFGVTVWLAPGMNLHRNPLCGRVFEYYSEDPVVSGKMAAALTRGVQKHTGKGVSIKHFCANNSEVERDQSSSNMNERTLRELYLKGFKIAVKESNPMTVMASYNKINGIYSPNNHDLLVRVLRNEWGYQGLVMSDWSAVSPETGDILKAAAAQCDLIMPGTSDQVKEIMEGVNQNKISPDDLKRCAGRVLKLVRSNTILKSE